MSAYSLAFVRGVFMGCGVVTVLLILSSILSKELSSSFWYEEKADAVALSERRTVLFFDKVQTSQMSSGLAGTGAEEGSEQLTNSSTSANTEEEEALNLKEPDRTLLVVVVTSLSRLRRTFKNIRTTWGNMTYDYRLLVGSQGYMASTAGSGSIHVLSTDHADFPALPYLSIEELNFVLEFVESNFLDRYRWFLFAPTNIYVSFQQLQEFLGELDHNKLLYIGSPSNHSMSRGYHYCRSGPGIVLSHSALRTIKKLQPCLMEQRGRTLSSYQILGECFNSQVHTDCSLLNEVNLGKYFIHDTGTVTRNPAMLWKDLYSEMLTLYPIHDHHHLEAVHAFSQVRDIVYLQGRASRIWDILANDSLCQKDSLSCQLGSNVSRTAYWNFSHRCTLFSRGYVVEMRRKVQNWDTLQGNTCYSGSKLDPQYLIHGDIKRELKYATSSVMNIVQRTMSNLKLHRVPNVYRRYRGTVGKEYIFDLQLEGNGKLMEKRVSLIFPHNRLILTNESWPGPKSLLVNFVVPLDGLNRARVARFQRAYHNICVKKKENCRLIYVIFSSVNNDKRFLKAYLTRFKRRHSTFNYEFIAGEGAFDLAMAYDLGMSVLRDNELAFIATIDLNIADHFLKRCRLNTRQGSVVYYPEIFRYYDMQYVYRGKWHPRHYDYVRQHGRWITNGVACLFKSDYVTIGGYRAIAQWQVDPSILQTRLNNTLEVMVAPEPGVSKWYEAGHCDSSLPPALFSSCLSTQSDNLADRTSLASYLLQLEGKCSYNHKS